ncbi:hypothetical protein CROQUDRAFT_715502 [Cronartium quercuum f. sp. fusiforme G11]|uniref:Peptidase C15, pyroglutamyl peptidase I-like protein n=1 Tax=Cronartium quercuum f. sp. fusiforme G11 TaxID=708437 RepID=A0A9P6NLX7_9BASI|nr:hypothetical protein CROQUDRAFT_715502 [Cronartium quercuum f. sp. fusiforme G11]
MALAAVPAPIKAEVKNDPDDSKSKSNQSHLIHRVTSSPSLTNLKHPIRILLTGFGPFKTHIVNPSFEILAGLHLEPFAAHAEIIIHPEPVRVAYRTVRGLLPSLFGIHSRLDYVIHLGVSNQPPSSFKLEKGAHRDGYEREDVDGLCGPELEGKLEEGWEDWSKRDEYLHTSVDVDQVAREVESKVQANHPNVIISGSDDAGRYLCEYTFYTSLAHFHQHRHVLFLHVPCGLETNDLLQGRIVVEQLIWALIRCHASGGD